MKKSIASLILLLLVVVLTLTAIGGFIFAMINTNPDLLIFALVIAAAAVGIFVAYEIKAVNAEQQRVQEFMAQSKAHDQYTIRID